MIRHRECPRVPDPTNNVELPARHRDDGTEAAIKSTTAGGFNDVDLATQHVAAEDASRGWEAVSHRLQGGY